ncbi:MAG: hypothetical protein WCR97_02415 [Bacilli bacterium]
MKSFLGKILNLIGIIGLFITFCVVAITAIVGFSCSTVYDTKYSNFFENLDNPWYWIALGIFVVDLIARLFTFLYCLSHLISHKSFKSPLWVSVIYMVVILITWIGILIISLNIIGQENGGTSIVFLNTCGSLTVAFDGLLIVGNILNYNEK